MKPKHALSQELKARHSDCSSLHDNNENDSIDLKDHLISFLCANCYFKTNAKSELANYTRMIHTVMDSTIISWSVIVTERVKKNSVDGQSRADLNTLHNSEQ